MRILIVEEERTSRETLKTLLSKFFNDIEIVAVANTVLKAVQLIRKYQPDLVFLDIELPVEDGFTLLDHFDSVPFKIIFTTAYEKYALRAFRISAVDYLLKPIDLKELNEAIKKAKIQIAPQQDKQVRQFRNNYFGHQPKLSLATTEGYLFIKIEDIIRCKADGRYSIFYLKDGSKHITAKNLGEFESILHDFNFLRVHRSQIINLNKVKKFIKGKPAEVVMEDEAKVLISNTQREPLLDYLGLSQ